MYFLAGRLLCGFLHEQVYREMRAFYMQMGPLKRIGINLSEVNHICGPQLIAMYNFFLDSLRKHGHRLYRRVLLKSSKFGLVVTVILLTYMTYVEKVLILKRGTCWITSMESLAYLNKYIQFCQYWLFNLCKGIEWHFSTWTVTSKTWSVLCLSDLGISFKIEIK